MAITISIDNDRLVAANDQPLIGDESPSVQTPSSTDPGNEVDVTLSGGVMAGLQTPFNNFLNAGTIFGFAGLALTNAQKTFAATNDGASSSADFVKVTTTAGEIISDLKFSDSSGAALDGDQVFISPGVPLTTLDGHNIYLWSNGDFAIATDSATAGAGRVVAAFYLNDNDANHLQAQVQMVTFEPLSHPDATNPDDGVNWTDVLQVSAQGTLSFNFDNLPSGSFLYAAIGTSSAGLLVTGQDLNVNDSNKLGDLDTGGKDGDPSDTVNTSQGGIGATIGINSQHFTDASIPGGKADGAVGVFTLVKGFGSFDATVNGTSEGTGINVNEITYSDYVNAPSAKIFISQVTGSSAIGGAVRITLWEAGGGGNADHLPSALKPEEGYADTANSYSYIGDQSTDSHLRDDTPVATGSVTVKRGLATYTWTLANSGTAQGGITVTIDAAHPNTFTITGLVTSDTIGFAAADNPANPLDGTFNRFDVQSLANSNPVDIGRIDLDQGVSITHSVGDQLVVQDDGPTIIAGPSTQTVTHDETPGVDAGTDVPGTDFVTGVSGATIASLFTSVPNQGDDLDVALSGAIGFARSTSSLVSVTGGGAGTDGPATQELTYSLHVTDGTPSGVSTTEGTQIFLYNGTGSAAGLVLGRVGTEAGATDTAALGGTVAFALAANSLNGEVFIAQYLSLLHPTGGTSYDESISLITTSVQMVVTRTDKDGDSITDSDNNIGNLISFQDDGPNIVAAPSAATVTHDETPGVDSTDIAGTAFVTGGSGATVASLFTSVPSPGDDLDVAANPIGFARSTSSMLTLSTNDAGADGPAAQPLNYAISVADGTPSGVSTTEGTQIFMYNGPNGLVLGRVGTEAGATDTANASGTVAFALAVNPLTGELFTAQYLSLNHPTGGTSYDEAIHLVAGALQMSVTLTDKDGDTKTDSDNNIGDHVNFEDDGPNIVAAPSAATVTHDETPGVDAGTDVAGTAFVTGGSGATVASLFTNVPNQGDDLDVALTGAIGFARSTSSLLTISTNDAGADGPAAQPLNYALSVSDGAISGVSTSEGTQIFLYNGTGSAAGLILGRVGTEAGATDTAASGGTVAFALAVNPLTGEVFTAQYLSLNHPTGGSSYDESISLLAGAVQMSVTLTDKDGDTKTDSDNNIGDHIVFEDDGPSITANATGAPSITDSDNDLNTNNHASYAGNFVPVYGADGSAGTPVTYDLSTPTGDSGLIESGTGLHVFLFKVGDTVVGKSGTNSTTAATGTTVFVVSVNGSSGEVTLDQQRAVVHNPALSQGTSTTLTSAGLVVVNATAHDKDGDTASTHLDIGQFLNFTDDTPTITGQILGGTVDFVVGAAGTTSHSLNGAVGADITNTLHQSLSGVMQYTITGFDEPTSVYPNLDGVESADGTSVTYYSDATHITAVYQLTLDQTAGSGAGSYTFTVLQPPPIVNTNFNFTDLPSGQNLMGVIAQNKANIDTHGTAGTGDDTLPDGGLLVFPSNPDLKADGTFTNLSGTINTSKGGGPVTIGNGNQAFDNPSEGAYFMYVDNPNLQGVGGLGLTATNADDADTIRFDGTNQATRASVTIVQASGAGTDKRPGPAMEIHAYEANPGNVDTDPEARNLVNNPTVALSNLGTAAAQVNIIGVKIHDSTGAVIEYAKLNQTTGAAITQDLNADGIADDSAVGIAFNLGVDKAGTVDDIYFTTVSNLKANYTVELITATDHNLSLIQNVSGSYDIGGFNVIRQANVSPQDFHFSVQINDYDNDVFGGSAVTFANFAVHVNDVIFN